VTVLDRKLLRDIRRLWAQALAIALVMASGVATLAIGDGAYRSIHETRAAYYDRGGFADVFAQARRAPEGLAREIAALPGVAVAETRIVQGALLDLPDLAEPASAVLVSLPGGRQPRLNRLSLRSGRLPEPAAIDEAVVSEAFARAHGFHAGDRFDAIMNGRKRSLRIVGVALSPEYVYAIGPGDIVPDDRRFGVVWMPREALEAAFDLDGAFNSVSLKIWPGANEADVIRRLDDLLAPYGGAGAYGRRDQSSNSYLDSELQQLNAMRRVLPPIFLLVSAYLINMTLSRLLSLEREQIGLFKAVGYSDGPIAWHYLKLALLISAIGVAIGLAAGAWLGHGVTRLYAEFFHFPFLVFVQDGRTWLLAIVTAGGAALLGAVRAVGAIVRLAPATAMAPAAPPRFTRSVLEALLRPFRYSQLTMMALRRLARWPVRSGLTTLGLAFSAALLVASLFSLDSLETMIDLTFNQADRQNATLGFVEPRGPEALSGVRHLPGVLLAEPFRAAPVRLRNDRVSRRAAIIAKAPDSRLSRALDARGRPVAIPPHGLVLSSKLAEILGVAPGDMVEVEVLDGRRRFARVRVSAVVESYFGLATFMDPEALRALLGEAPRLSGAYVRFDEARSPAFFRAVKDSPAIGSLQLQERALLKFRETMARNINVMMATYLGLAITVAFGVIYNSARIQLSESARELASLRVLGFTNGEVSRMALTELGILVILSIPLGWALGYGLAAAMTEAFDSELFRIPLVVSRATYAKAALVVLAAAAFSAFIVRDRIARFDLVTVLKTRD
jgi:putative ABC transport system permease protein